ncbi:hypothetical protein [Prochlorococcus sp. MIT 1303]|uniref:hypothetical protein n=1 Tax=Prochlorococcus sp. MIT 1303 TaxID=1723647 RepID=UPI000ABE0339|nr:hypothetical protein [Prochlorococcus sp. MIT 1303]
MVRLTLVVLVMTFLRVGSLPPPWGEVINWKKNLWTIPADRIKTDKAHQVPMTERLKLP